MKAIGIERGGENPQLLEVPQPEPGDGDVLVRTLSVGIDGTDHEVIAGSHRTFPDDSDHLILGHEAVGVVEAAPGTRFTPGDVVVPTVRRPIPNGNNEYFARGEPDMAPLDATLERGIHGAHGFMSEYFVSPEGYLLSIPPEIATYGYLLEPISVSEKALELAYTSRSSFSWQPESVAVLGNGPLGLLTVAMLSGETRVYCLGRRARPDPTIDIIERLGAEYIDSRVTPVDAIGLAYEPMDLIYEATGYAKHAFESVHALAPNGVVALLGVPEPWTFEIEGGGLHKALVMQNKAIVGSVNSRMKHFEAAIDRLTAFPTWFLEELVTTVPLDSFEAAFEGGEKNIKTTIQFDEYEKR